MRGSSIVALESQAAATLRYIRASMDAAGSVAVSGSAGITIGLIGVFAAVLTSMGPLRPYWLVVWLCAGVIAACAGFGLMARQASLQGFTLAGAPARKFILCLVPGLFAGAVMTAVLWRAGDLHAIPGTWMLLYGCALVSTSAPTSKIVGILGTLFVLLGLLAFWLPQNLQLVALGLGFGVLQIIAGFLLARSSHASES